MGPNDDDIPDIEANNSPDPPNDDDEVIEPQDYSGEFGLDEDDTPGDYEDYELDETEDDTDEDGDC